MSASLAEAVRRDRRTGGGSEGFLPRAAWPWSLEIAGLTGLFVACGDGGGSKSIPSPRP